MKTFDGTNLTSLRDDIESALAAVAEKHNIVIRTGSGSYTSTTFDLKLKMSVKLDGVADELNSPEAAEFMKWAKVYGFDSDDLGRTFVLHGKPFKLIGLRRKNRSYPIIASTDDGKTYKLSVTEVHFALNK